MTTMRRFKLNLLGSFSLFAPNGDRIEITSKKGMGLIALLAMARSGERTRGWVQDHLWGSRGAEQAQASLRRELSNLRAALNRDEELLIAEPARIRIDLDRVDVDVRLIEANLSSGRNPIAITPGELLEGIDIPGEEGFEDWLRTQRRMIADLLDHQKRRTWEEAALRVGADPVAERTPDHPSPAELVAMTDLPLPDRPSIAVLPFTAGAAEDAPIAEGIAEEIGIALSRFSTLFVSSSSSSFTYRDASVDRSRICRELGVRYLLEGSIRRAGAELRIAVRLIDGVLRQQLWAESFHDSLDRVFNLQDRVVATIAPLIDSSIEKAERHRAIAQPVQSPDAYALYWRANALFRQWEPAPMREAIGLVEQVLEREPNNAWAASLAGFCHAMALLSGWVEDADASRTAALGYYERAMRFGGEDPHVLGYAAGILVGVGGDMAVADNLIARAQALHPANASTLFWGAWVDIANGNSERALERFEGALRINPRAAVRPHAVTGIGLSLLVMGRTAEAVIVLTEAVQHAPHHPLTLACISAALAHAGAVAPAQGYAARLQSVGGSRMVSILSDPRHRAIIEQGLAIAAGLRPPSAGSEQGADCDAHISPQACNASLSSSGRMAAGSSA